MRFPLAESAGAVRVELPGKKSESAQQAQDYFESSVGLIKSFDSISVARLMDVVDLIPDIIADSPEAELVFDLRIRNIDGEVSKNSKQKLDELED